MKRTNLRSMMADAKFMESYSRFNDEMGRYETWDEAVERVMSMHQAYYADKMSPELESELDKVETLYKDKRIVGAQRALQFGGDQLLKKHMRLYNCSATYVDRPGAFNEIFWSGLCGAGVGISVQKHHIDKLPKIRKRTKHAKIYLVPDTVEGWADALGVLMSSFFVGGGVFPEYEGRRVFFDTSDIRPKGSRISGGFKAPGPAPLEKALRKIEHLLTDMVKESDEDVELRPIDAFDCVMHAADAVIAGGVRRAAIITLFSPDDEEMAKSKTGDWFQTNKQRGRSNNSALLVRGEVTKEEFGTLFESLKEFGEPGFIFGDDKDYHFNPCLTGDAMVSTKNGEIAMVDLIELVKRGDAPEVWSYNIDTDEFEWDTITDGALTRKDTGVIELELEDGKTVKCTPDHLILTSNRGYVEAKDLTNKDDVVIDGGVSPLIQMTGVANEDVYDITVEKNHNFVVNGVVVHNCAEIGLLPKTEKGASGFQVCNLSEINGAKCATKEAFFEACEAAAIIGTIQAGYTDLEYLGPITKEIVEREALIGVSVTGWMNNPDVLFDTSTLKKGAKIVKDTNKRIAQLIDINQAARCTTTKPAGNVSVLLETASGIHPEHSKRYLRNVQINKELEVGHLIKETNPYMVEESVWSENKTDYVISFPVVAPGNSIFKSDMMGIDLLEKVKQAQKYWVGEGTNEELCVKKGMTHNISNTITVDDNWDEVRDYVYKNRHNFAGISFLSASGDKDYHQAPFTEVLTSPEIVRKYGDGSLLASGLIVDAHDGFDNLWEACASAQYGIESDSQEVNDLRANWIRRFKKFAANHFEGDEKETAYCLKDVYLFYKWSKIQSEYTKVDFVADLKEKTYTDINTMSASACHGGSCDIS